MYDEVLETVGAAFDLTEEELAQTLVFGAPG
jgi:hypothetical protein